MLGILGAVSLIFVVLLAVLFYTNAFRLFIPLRGWMHEIPHKTAPARLKPDLGQMTDDRLSVAWIGHATCLINFYGTWILTDPVFSRRVGIETMFGVFGSRRLVEPALTMDELPEVDVIIVTHAHMDHFDLPTLRNLSKDATLLTPPGFSDFTDKLGYEKTIEIGWGGDFKVDGLAITAFRPQHWGNRTPWEKVERGYNGYLFSKNGKTVLLAGDTGYSTVFEKLGKKHHIDAAIFNLGAYLPKWFQRNHATSEEVWKMFKQSGADTLIPIHWGAFIHSQENIEDPVNWLRAAAGDEFYDKVGLLFQGEVWRKR